MAEYRLVHNCAKIFIAQYTAPFNVKVYYRADAREPYIKVARGPILNADGLRRFLTAMGVNGKSQLDMDHLPNSLIENYTIDEFMEKLGRRGNEIPGSESLIVQGVTLEEVRQRLNQWSQETDARWLDLVELERAKQAVKIYYYISAELLNIPNVPVDVILRHELGVRFGGHTDQEILQRAIDELERENVIRVIDMDGNKIIRSGGMWHILGL